MTTVQALLRAKEAEDLAQYLLDFAGQLRAHSQNEEAPRLFWPEDSLGLHETAERILAFRANRTRHLDASLFGEQAWDLLLTLFKVHRSATSLSVDQICKSIGPYESTARRWLDILVNLELVAVTDEGGDVAFEAARLTERGEMAMTKTIVALQDALTSSGRHTSGSALFEAPNRQPS